MERIIRTLVIVARFIENAAEQLKQRAIAKLEQRKAQARNRRTAAIQAQADAWQREIERHKRELGRINHDSCKAEDLCQEEEEKFDDKIKRLELS